MTVSHRVFSTYGKGDNVVNGAVPTIVHAFNRVNRKSTDLAHAAISFVDALKGYLFNKCFSDLLFTLGFLATHILLVSCGRMLSSTFIGFSTKVATKHRASCTAFGYEFRPTFLAL